jgi:hypothetical protein
MSVLLVADVHGRTALEPQLRALLGELADGSRAEPQCAGFRVLASEEQTPGCSAKPSLWLSSIELASGGDERERL